MAIEEALANRIKQLIDESRTLVIGNEVGQVLSEEQSHECSAWLSSAQNAVQIICESPDTPYRIKADRIANKSHGWVINGAVGEMAAVLRNLLADANAGFLASVADRARAELMSARRRLSAPVVPYCWMKSFRYFVGV